MKQLNFVLLSTLTLLILLTSSCKKKSNPAGPDTVEAPEIPVNPTNPSGEIKLLIPQSISTDNLKIDFQYASTGNVLTEIRQSNGTREMVTYNGKLQLKEYKRYLRDDLLYRVDYILNSDGLPIKAIQYNVEAGGKLISPIGYYQLTYNDNKQIETVDWYDFKNMLINTRTFIYNTAALFIESTTNGKQPLKQSYTYDEQQGLFKQVLQLQPLSLENEAFYMLNIKSNVKNIRMENQPASDRGYEMQYNASHYPSTITETDITGKSKIYKITYR